MESLNPKGLLNCGSSEMTKHSNHTNCTRKGQLCIIKKAKKKRFWSLATYCKLMNKHRTVLALDLKLIQVREQWTQIP